jgi:EC042_2821-lke REase
MPFAFETPAGVIQTVFADDTKGAAGKVARLLAEQEDTFPFDASKAYNVGVEVELRFIRKANDSAVAVKITPSDPNALPVTIKEEDILKTYQWKYEDLRHALHKRFKKLQREPNLPQYPESIGT